MVAAVEAPPPCLFTSVRLCEGERELCRSTVRVYDDREWTLRRPVEFSRVTDVPDSAELVWCDHSREVMTLDWSRARRWLGEQDRSPAGTSLLKLIDEM